MKKMTQQETEFREACKVFGDYFSSQDIDCALSDAREIGGEEYVAKMTVGVRTLHQERPNHFSPGSGADRSAQWRGKDYALLSLAQYRSGSDGVAATLRTDRVLRVAEDSETQSFLKRRVGAGDFDFERNVVIERG